MTTIMKRASRPIRWLLLAGGMWAWGVASWPGPPPPGVAVPDRAPIRISVSFGREVGEKPIDGRLLVLLSTSDKGEPGSRSTTDPKTQQIFGINVDGLAPDQEAVIDEKALGYPVESLRQVPPGRYRVQAVLHKYETFHRADGHTVKLPMDRGEGQQWARAPGNLYSTPQDVTIEPGDAAATIRVRLDKVIPPIPEPATTKYIKHEQDPERAAHEVLGPADAPRRHVLLPEGFDEHPEARYPLVIFHGHFPQTFGGFREEPPDPEPQARVQRAVPSARL